MLDDYVMREIVELMSAMRLPFVAIGSGEDKEYFSTVNVSDISFDDKHQLLEDMRDTYELLNNTPWYLKFLKNKVLALPKKKGKK